MSETNGHRFSVAETVLVEFLEHKDMLPLYPEGTVFMQGFHGPFTVEGRIALYGWLYYKEELVHGSLKGNQPRHGAITDTLRTLLGRPDPTIKLYFEQTQR